MSGHLPGTRTATLAVLTPQSKIDAGTTRTEHRLLLALLATLLLVGIVAWLEGRSIVRSIRRLVTAANAIARGDLDKRVPVHGRDELALLARSFNDMAEQLGARLQELETERARLQDAITLFGEALAATHDIDQLLRVVLDVEIEATGAAGGIVIVEGTAAAQVGEIDGADRIEVPLRAGESNFGHMILTGPGFDDEDRLTAVSIAAHAVVALDNARLHRIVRHQALIDGLTGLANRRHAERSLETELARAERFGGPLAVVLCDLDDFKDVNDQHGHLVGDDVLRELATVLEDTVRTVDVAARWGGEEFALILPGTDAEGGAQLAERAREALADRTILTQEGVPVRVTAVSFGVAALARARRGRRAARSGRCSALSAKNQGKNRVETAPGVPGPSVRRRRTSQRKPGRKAAKLPPGHPGPNQGEVCRRDRQLTSPKQSRAPRAEAAQLGAERQMPLNTYKSDDPFENHPLFKTEEQARRARDDGRQRAGSRRPCRAHRHADVARRDTMEEPPPPRTPSSKIPSGVASPATSTGATRRFCRAALSRASRAGRPWQARASACAGQLRRRARGSVLRRSGCDGAAKPRPLRSRVFRSPEKLQKPPREASFHPAGDSGIPRFGDGSGNPFLEERFSLRHDQRIKR